MVKVNIGIPGFFSIEGKFTPNEVDKEAAWELYIELITRITIIGLDDKEGILREALNSFYSLFKTTREILKRKGPELAKPKDQSKISLGLIAISMLNYVLRPFLTKWHSILEEYESIRPSGKSQKAHEGEWEKNKKFRAALKEVRESLNHYAQLLSEIAEIDQIHNIPLIK